MGWYRKRGHLGVYFLAAGGRCIVKPFGKICQVFVTRCPQLTKYKGLKAETLQGPGSKRSSVRSFCVKFFELTKELEVPWLKVCPATDYKLIFKHRASFTMLRCRVAAKKTTTCTRTTSQENPILQLMASRLERKPRNCPRVFPTALLVLKNGVPDQKVILGLSEVVCNSWLAL